MLCLPWLQELCIYCSLCLLEHFQPYFLLPALIHLQSPFMSQCKHCFLRKPFLNPPVQIRCPYFRLMFLSYSKSPIFYPINYEQCYLTYDLPNRLQALRGQSQCLSLFTTFSSAGCMARNRSSINTYWIKWMQKDQSGWLIIIQFMFTLRTIKVPDKLTVLVHSHSTKMFQA